MEGPMRASTLVLSLCAALIAGPAPAATHIFAATLTGGAEFPPNGSPAQGASLLYLDDVAHTLRIKAEFDDLLGVTTAAHIHAPTADPGIGAAPVVTQTPTFAGFPLGVTSGTWDWTFDTTQASTWNAPFVTANGGPLGAEAALLTALQGGRAYFNIHTNQFPGGEIRGFYAQAVPEPSSWALMIAGFGAAGGLLRRRSVVAAI
jgi:hypothetical protein